MSMIIGQHLRSLRLEKKLSQGDLEKRTSLPRSYVSRIENGHSTPTVETLQKLAYALEIPLYRFFYNGPEPPELPNSLSGESEEGTSAETSPKDQAFLSKLRPLIGRVDELDRQLFLHLARKMARR